MGLYLSMLTKISSSFSTGLPLPITCVGMIMGPMLWGNPLFGQDQGGVNREFRLSCQ